jgi:hypothetical protein
MKQNKITHIKYTRATNLGGGESGDITERYIIPTFIPQDNIKAIDVTSLSEEERDELQKLWNDYQSYYQNAVASLFDFDTWVEHSTGKSVEAKWRTFKKENTEILD